MEMLVAFLAGGLVGFAGGWAAVLWLREDPELERQWGDLAKLRADLERRRAQRDDHDRRIAGLEVYAYRVEGRVKALELAHAGVDHSSERVDRMGRQSFAQADNS